jgi:hypothetical protein
LDPQYRRPVLPYGCNGDEAANNEKEKQESECEYGEGSEGGSEDEHEDDWK